jgi:cell shape-determining protein MreC
MTIWAIAFIISTALAATGFVVVAILWLRKLRETLAGALGETAGQQIRTAQRLSEALAQIQRQQTLNNQRIQSLAEANIYLQKELSSLSERLDTNDQVKSQPTHSRLLH